MIVDILYINRKPRIYKNYSPTLRSERIGLLVIEVNNKKQNNNLINGGTIDDSE